jgi:hypothetical protein
MEDGVEDEDATQPAAAVVPNDNDDDETEMVYGPEQGGASGHPIEEQDTPEDYVPQPVNVNGNGMDEMIAFLRRGSAQNPIDWPTTGPPVNDYSTPDLQAAAFPTLFPFGRGDVTNRDRMTTVTLQAANHHLLWFCIKKSDGLFHYPFAEHDRWMYWAQNTDERHRFNLQKNVYLDKSPAHTELTLERINEIVNSKDYDALREITDERHRFNLQKNVYLDKLPAHTELSLERINEIVNSKDYDALREITGRMQMWSSNILGSDGYFAKSRKNLEALMQQEGLPTLNLDSRTSCNHERACERGNQSAGCTHSIQRLPPYNDSPTTTSRCQCRPTGQCHNIQSFECHCSSMLQGC